MGNRTSIEWTAATWNAIRGCRRTTAAGSTQSGCGDQSGGGCYAERQAYRFSGPGGAYEGLVRMTPNGPRWTGKVRFVSEHLLDPLKWRTPRRIFTDSMSDMFYEGVTDHVIDKLVAVMMISCLHTQLGGHTFQTLTKRPERMRAYFSDPATQGRVARAAGEIMEDGDGWHDVIAYRTAGLLHPKMWWGTSIENHAAADERLLPLLATPAMVRFVSIEPLLGPVVLGLIGTIPSELVGGAYQLVHERLSWVIVGCESGPRMRPCRPEWIRALRDECAETQTPFFLKQAQAATDLGNCMTDGAALVTIGAGSKASRSGVIKLPYLDGVQHAAFPEVPDAI